MYPNSIRQLIRAFSRLPTVGPRTAERFVFSLLRSGKKEVSELIHALTYLVDTVKSCATCWDFADTSPCMLCADHTRDQSTICVVRDSQEVQIIEKTGSYRGTYHVLRGVLSPGDEHGVGVLKIPELLKRAEESSVREIILALNPDLAGETTMMYIGKKIRDLNPIISITRLARGLPMGSDVQYADEITLSSAIRQRIPQ